MQINENTIRYAFFGHKKIRAFERYLPVLFSSALTTDKLEQFFKVVKHLPPLYVSQQFHKLWSVLSKQTGTELQLQAIAEFQYYLRGHQKYYPRGVVEKQLELWGYRETELFTAHYTTNVTS